MKIYKQHFGNFAVLKISGKMAESMETCGLFDIIRDLVRDNVYRIIIDMKEISLINITGIGALMGCYSYLDSHNVELILVNTSKSVKEILTSMELLPYFRQYNSVHQALIGTHQPQVRAI